MQVLQFSERSGAAPGEFDVKNEIYSKNDEFCVNIDEMKLMKSELKMMNYDNSNDELDR